MNPLQKKPLQQNSNKYNIFKHLKKYGSITRYRAANVLHTFELARPIAELEAIGVVIERQPQKLFAAMTGREVHYIKYVLTDDGGVE